VIPLIAMMLWMGVYSQSFLPPVSRTTAHVLEQTQVNVPFQVRMVHSPRMPVEAADAR
jgi:NADH-quinone oxidoreductase subunit M